MAGRLLLCLRVPFTYTIERHTRRGYRLLRGSQEMLVTASNLSPSLFMVLSQVWCCNYTPTVLPAILSISFVAVGNSTVSYICPAGCHRSVEPINCCGLPAVLLLHQTHRVALRQQAVTDVNDNKKWMPLSHLASRSYIQFFHVVHISKTPRKSTVLFSNAVGIRV